MPTLYPEALTFRPLLVRVDFMRTKKERSWTRKAGDVSVGLASGGEQEGTGVEFAGSCHHSASLTLQPLQKLRRI